MDVIIRGLVRGTAAAPNYPDGANQIPTMNPRGETLVAAGLPPLASIVALKNSWWATTTTAAAPVTAIPTTASLLLLYNGDLAKSCIVDSVFAVEVAATAAVQSFCILGNISISTPTYSGGAAVTARSLYANLPYAGRAIASAGSTLDAANGIAANWQPLGSSVSGTNTTQIGIAIDHDLRGRIILPPLSMLALTVLAGAATATSVQLGLRWHEALLPL